jgi:sulfite exporter TauE/SafE
MCGGVSAALSMAIPAEKQHFWGRLGYLLNYNLGRILSYVLAGALVGRLARHHHGDRRWQTRPGRLRLIAAFLMIALGLYLAGWWHGVLLLERIREVLASHQAAGGQFSRLHQPGRPSPLA